MKDGEQSGQQHSSHKCRCHVERSETSLIFSLAESVQKESEILGSAQNDIM